MSKTSISSFAQLGLSDAVTRAVYDVGYETPSPIQAAAIVPLLEGKDIIGQAQTGTGKTAAFALPLLSRLDISKQAPQILVLTPTRELAIQVSEALQTYARHMTGFHVLPVYGGQALATQLRPLRRGVHAVVGTPGRLLDHLRRGTLKLDNIATVVLDEADEMLRMGFIDDVGAILDRAPATKQLALFSATMPDAVRSIARRHTREPVEVKVKSETSTVATVSQFYWQVSGVHKLDALTRMLEVEDFDAMLVFVRTKTATTELAERLEARGLSAAPLNGDMNQAMRELTIERLKNGRLDILVATDVAARGLDVGRISHVVNFDIPYDTEAYVHRIGRTARAGRKGKAILFVAPRERRMLRTIERATGQSIEPMQIPSLEDVAGRREERFKTSITDVLESEKLAKYESLVVSLAAEQKVEPARIAAALAFMVQAERMPAGVRAEPKSERPSRKPERGFDGSGDRAPKRKEQRRPDVRPPDARTSDTRPSDDVRKSDAQKSDAQKSDAQKSDAQKSDAQKSDAQKSDARKPDFRKSDGPRPPARGETSFGKRPEGASRTPTERPPKPEQFSDRELRARGGLDQQPPARNERSSENLRPARRAESPDADQIRYRVEVGSSHGVEAKNIVGAIANEAGLDSQFIGAIDIQENHSTVDLPEGMPKDVFRHLKRVWVGGRQLNISVSKDEPAGHSRHDPSPRPSGPRPAPGRGAPDRGKSERPPARQFSDQRTPDRRDRADDAASAGPGNTADRPPKRSAASPAGPKRKGKAKPATKNKDKGKPKRFKAQGAAPGKPSGPPRAD